MENKNQDPSYGTVDNGVVRAPAADLGMAFSGQTIDPGSLSVQDPLALSTQSQQPATDPKQPNILVRLVKRADVILAILLLLSMIGVFIATASKDEQSSQNGISSEFATQDIALKDFESNAQGVSFGGSSVAINGLTQLNGGLVVTPSLQPSSPKTGQLYYDQTTNRLGYYNGSEFILMPSEEGAVVQSLGGLTGQVSLAGGLSIVGNQLVNAGVLSLGGQGGAIVLGNGLNMAGNSLQNTGVLNLVAGTDIAVTNDGNGNFTVSNTGAGTGTVTSGGGTAGILPLFTSSQNIEDSIITQTGMTVTITGDLSVVTGGLSLSNALTVGNGGTGTASLAANGVIVGNGTSALGSVTAGGAGLCLMSTAGAPTWSACPGASGVTSLNGLTGALSVANASAAGSIVTIDDATTATKGIASFSSTNFSVAGGAVNTIQNINTGATPTFAGVNTNTIDPSATLTVGDTGQSLILQGNGGTVLTATNGASTTTVGFTAPTANVTINFPALVAGGPYDVCTSAGNCLGGGAGGANTALSNLTGVAINTSLLPGVAGAVNLGSGALPFGDIFLAGTSGTPGTNNFRITGVSTSGTRTITIPDASGTLCLTTGNCSGTGGGVTTAGGTIGTLPVFTAGQVIGDSLVSQSGGTVTVAGHISLSAGNQYQINGTQISSANLSNDSNLAKLSASQTFTGTTNAFQNTANTTNAFNVQNAAGTRIFTVDTSNGEVELGIASTLDGKLVFNNVSNANSVTIAPGTPTGPRTITLPDDSGEVCLDTGNCDGAGATLQTAYNFSVGGTTPKIKVDSTLLGVDIQDADTTIGANLFNVRESNAGGLGQVMLGISSTGQFTLQNGTNSTTALRLLSDGGTSVLTGDTTNGRIILGQSSTLDGTLVFNNATNGNQVTLTSAAASAPRSIVLPNADGTVCVTSGNCAGVGGTGDILQGGNSFTAAMTIGTNDAFDLNFETNGVPRLTVESDGSQVTLASNVDLVLQGATAYISNPQGKTRGESFGSGAATDDDSVAFGFGATAFFEGTAIGSGAVNVSSGSISIGRSASSNFQSIAIGANSSAGLGSVALGQGAVVGNQNSISIGRAAATTADNQLVVGSSSSSITHAVFGSGVTNASAGTLDVLLQATSGSGLNIAGADLFLASGQGTGNANSGNINFEIADPAASGSGLNTRATVLRLRGSDGAANFQNSTDSPTGFSVLNVAGTPQFRIDTSASRAYIGSPTADATGALLILDDKNTSGDPSTTGVTSGAMYYNSNAGKFRCFENLTWVDCLVPGGGSTAFIQNGNSFGGAATLGTNDAFDLNIERGGATQLTVGNGSITLASNVDLSLQGATAYISNPQGQTASEAFGLNADINGINSLAVGTGAVTDANGESTAIGSAASAGENTVAVGWSVNAQANAVGVGNDVTVESGGVAIGASANIANGHLSSIAIGHCATTTASNQMVIGSGSGCGTSYINSVFIGSGVTDTAPQGFTLQGTGGSGSNIAGADVTIAGGRSTGSAAGGNVIIQASAAGGAGSSLNSLATVATFAPAAVTLGSNVDLLLQGTTAYISNTQGQSSSEAFGNNAVVSSTSALAVGNNATATGQFSTAVGDGTEAGFASTALGRLADASGQQSTALGAHASATFFGSIAIGEAATTTAANQLVIGSTSADGSEIGQVYVGSGVTDVAPTSVTIQGTGGSGSNVAGASVTLAAGKSTGSANGGNLNFQISAPGGAGASLNSLTTVASFSGASGAALFQNAVNSTSAFKIQNTAGTQLLNVSTVANPGNVITNGSLEQNTTNWAAKGGASISRVTSQHYVGVASLQTVTTAAIGDGARYNVTLSSSTQYTASMYLRLSSGTFNNNLSIGYSSDGVSEVDCKTGETVKTGGWLIANCTFTTGTVSGTPYFYWEQADATARTVFVDAFQIVAGADIGAYYDGKLDTGGLIFNGPLAIQNDTDSNSVFQVQDAQGQSLFGIDAVNKRVGVNLIQPTATFEVASLSTTNVAAIISQHNSSTQDIFRLRKGSTAVLTVAHTGATTFTNNTDSANAFRVLTSGSGELVGVDSLDSVVRLLGNNTGHLIGNPATSQWYSSSNTLPSARGSGAAVTLNGYLYEIGGCDSGGGAQDEVYVSRVNSDGSIGSWSATTSLPVNLCGNAATTYNGYIYVHGGGSSAAISRDIFYAKPNADGTITNWITQDDPTNLDDQNNNGMVAYNGYLYSVGGLTNGGSDLRHIYYGRINADGSVPSFVKQTDWLPSGSTSPSQTVIANGYIYVMGSSNYNKFYFGRIDPSNGAAAANTLATGTTDQRRYALIGVMNGYMYVIGGDTSGTDTFQYGQLGANGDIPSFTASSLTTEPRLPALRSVCHNSAPVVNNYIYMIGCGDGSFTAQATVYYAGGTRVRVGGSLDLVSYSGEGMSEGSSGGQLTAGNTFINGLVSVTGNATFKDGATIGSSLTVNGSALVRGQAGGLQLLQVQNAGNAAALNISTVNYVGNSNFETGTTGQRPEGWTNKTAAATLTTSTSQALYGTRSMSVVTAGGTASAGAQYNFVFGPSTQYTLSFWVRTSSGSFATANIGRQDNGSTDTDCLTGQTFTTTWTRFTCTFTTGATIASTSNFYIKDTSTTAHTYFVDGVQLEAAALPTEYRTADVRIDGPMALRPTANSSNLFQIQNSSSASVVNVNTLTATNEVLTNDFENGHANGWSLRGSAANLAPANNFAQFGRYSLNFDTLGASGNGVQYKVGLKPSTQYSLSLWARRDSGSSSTFNIGRADNGSDTDCLTGQTFNATFTQFTCTFTTGATIGTSSNIYVKQTDTSTDNLFIDGITLYQSAAPVTYATPANNLHVDAAYNNVTINGGNNGEVQPWQLNDNSLTEARSRPGSVIYNGYLYVVGGGTVVDGATVDATGNVMYAKINADGTVGSFSTTTNLGTAVSATDVVVVNGYIYVVGGSTTGAAAGAITTVQYARINNDGTVGTWANATAALTAARSSHSVVAYNGYIYAIGGFNTSASAQATVYYAKVNANGDITAWTTSGNPMSTGGSTHGAAAGNGYLYVLGVGSGGGTRVEISKLNSDGSNGGFFNSTGGTTPALPTSKGDMGVAVMNGYIYAIGGWDGSANSTITYYAPLKANGATGAWLTASSALPVGRENMKATVANGYIYLVGGDTTATQTSVMYTSGARLKVGGSLDLVGAGGQNLNEGNTGGQLTAGNTIIVGTLEVQDSVRFNGALTVGGTAVFRNSNDSSSAFGVLNAAAVPLFSVDTSNSRVYIGNPVADSTGALLVLDTKDTSGDPTGVDGGMYYNSDADKFRCRENGNWKNCLGLSQNLTLFGLNGNGNAAGWDNMPAAETEFMVGVTGIAVGANRMRYDLTDAEQIRLQVNVELVGSASAEIRIQYSTDQSTWNYIDNANTGLGQNISTTGLKVSSWAAIASGAKGDVYLRLTGINGNASTDPEFGLIQLQIR